MHQSTCSVGVRVTLLQNGPALNFCPDRAGHMDVKNEGDLV
jgi:hypothetical protein